MTLTDVCSEEYPDPDGIFFNAASHGLLPLRTVRASAELLHARNRPGGVDEGALGSMLWRCRAAAARLVSCDPAEITLAPNTTFGVSLGAELVAAGPPGVVLLPDGEFPTNVYPWLALRKRGFQVRFVPLDQRGFPDEDRLFDEIGRKDVRALALSAVQFQSGYRCDLAELGARCRDRGVLFVIDAIQALGVAPLSVREVSADVLATGGQKWLCSPWGSGFAYVRRELREAFDPPMVSWLSMKDARDFNDMLGYGWGFLDDGRKFELATLGIQDYVGLSRSLELFLEVGVERVREHVFDVQTPLLEWIDSGAAEAVTPLDPERRAGVFSFRVPDPRSALEALARADVTCSFREGAIRFAPHFYNTRAHMARAVEALDSISGG